MLTPQQAYDYSLQQERQGNFQAAFETLVDMQNIYPNFMDVPARLGNYARGNYRYTGRYSLFKQGVQTPPPPPPNVSGFPPPPPRKRNFLIPILVGVVTVLFITAIVLLVLVLKDRLGSSNQPTAVSQATTVPATFASVAFPPETPLARREPSPTTGVETPPALTPETPTVELPTPEIVDTPTLTTEAPPPTPTEPETLTPEITTPSGDLEEIDYLKGVLNKLPGSASGVIILPGGVFIGLNEEKQVPAGGLINLWIAATVYNEGAEGRLDLTETYTLKSSDQVPGTGTLNQPGWVGGKFTYEDLVFNMLVHSDNTAANILLQKLQGFDKVNRYASDNGYSETRLQRWLGKPDSKNENLTSARDCAAFFFELLNGKIVNYDVSNIILDTLVLRVQEGDNAVDQGLNMFGKNLPKEAVYGHVSGQGTGLRNEVGYFLKYNGKPVVAVVLYTGNEKQGEDAISRAIGDAWVITAGRN